MQIHGLVSTMRRHWMKMIMIIIIWWWSLHCIILLYIALQKCRYTHCWSQWVSAPSNWHGGPIQLCAKLCATLWATLCATLCHPGPHYAIGSFTYPLAAGSEAGNLSMPYYATPYHTMPFYYAIAILLQHWHPQHTMTLAIQVANWVYQGGPLHNQCGLHGVLYAISMYLLYGLVHQTLLYTKKPTTWIGSIHLCHPCHLWSGAH